MRYLIFIVTIFTSLILSCNSKDNKANETSRLLPEPDINERLKYQKRIIDTLFNKDKAMLIVFAKLVDKEDLLEIKNGEFPDGVETTYNLLKDSLGRIITASEFPNSESDDWHICLTHYFDKEEKTFAFERITNFFNSMCAKDDGVAYETKTEYYDRDLQVVDKEYKLVGEDNLPLQKDSCEFPYEYDYKVISDVEEYLRIKGIKQTDR